MATISWDDLRYILAVADNGSLAGAARTLGVNHTTVLRRIDAFERALGLRLFDRLTTGYTMTAGGEELLLAARQVADTVTTLERRLAGQDARLDGELRVTTTDTLALTILMPHLGAFQARHPGIALDLTIGNGLADLGRRDADVAIRPTAEPPETLIGRRVATLAFAIYAAPDFTTAADDLAAQPWIGPDTSLSGTTIAAWMRRELPTARVVCRVDSLMAMRAAVASGLGLGVLPCYVGDTGERLVRIEPVLPGLEGSLWLLTHEDLRGTARVRAFTDFLARALEAERDLFEGRRPQR